MSTLHETINAVCDDLNRTDLTAQASDAVVMAIRHFDRKRWWFSESSATFTTTSTTSTYPLATDFRAMDYVEVRWPGDNWQELKSRDFGTVKRMLEGQTVTGYPEVYALRDSSLELAYQPNSEYLVRYYYLKALTDLTAEASNSWTTDCKDLIRAHAARTVALRTLHDVELAQVLAAVEQEEYQRLIEENDRRTTIGKATPHY